MISYMISYMTFDRHIHIYDIITNRVFDIIYEIICDIIYDIKYDILKPNIMYGIIQKMTKTYIALCVISHKKL